MWYGLGISLISLNAALASRGFSPASLFENSEDGAVYEVADVTSMRVGRDGSGGVPGVGDPVGLVLDKSQMGRKTAAQFIASQPELVTNGTFDSDTSGWSFIGDAASLEAAGGVATLTRGTSTTIARPAVTTVVGEYYEITLTVISISDANGFRFGVGATTKDYTSPGTYSLLAKATQTSLNVSITKLGVNVGSTLVLDNVSVKHVPGNHLTAPSDAARPVYQKEIVEGTAVDVSGQPELVTNGTFDSDISGWTAYTNTTFTRSTSEFSNGGGLFSCAVTGASTATGVSTTPGAWYLVSGDFSGVTSNFRFMNGPIIGSGAEGLFESTDQSGSFSYLTQASAATTYFNLKCNANESFHIDNISIREVPASAARRHKLVDDEVDDALNVTLPDLGSNATELIVTPSSTTINTSQTIGAGSRQVLQNDLMAYLVIDRSLTADETALLTAYANNLRGV